MNNRIQQLADHAKAYANQCTKDIDGDVSWHWMEYYTEKFAELILIEVTDILSTYRGKVVFTDGAEYNYEHPIIAIRKHFGVKQ